MLPHHWKGHSDWVCVASAKHQTVLNVTVKSTTHYNLLIGADSMNKIYSNYIIIFKMKSTARTLTYWLVDPIPTNKSVCGPTDTDIMLPYCDLC